MSRPYFAAEMKRSKVYLSRLQSRKIDEMAIAEGMTSIQLMENAGRACTNHLEEQGCESAVICCGSGNNGGDGFVIARRLAILGLPVKILLVGDAEKILGDARVNLEIVKGIGLDLVRFDENWNNEELQNQLDRVDGQTTDWIVDCLLGTGAHGDPRPPMDRVIRAANGSSARRLAVDVPSGLDCDNGKVGDPTFQADVTCTFVARKTGFHVPEARPFLGQVKVVAIGVSMELIQRVQAEWE